MLRKHEASPCAVSCEAVLGCPRYMERRAAASCASSETRCGEKSRRAEMRTEVAGRVRVCSGMSESDWASAGWSLKFICKGGGSSRENASRSLQKSQRSSLISKQHATQSPHDRACSLKARVGAARTSPSSHVDAPQPTQEATILTTRAQSYKRRR